MFWVTVSVLFIPCTPQQFSSHFYPFTATLNVVELPQSELSLYIIILKPKTQIVTSQRWLLQKVMQKHWHWRLVPIIMHFVLC